MWLKCSLMFSLLLLLLMVLLICRVVWGEMEERILLKLLWLMLMKCCLISFVGGVFGLLERLVRMLIIRGSFFFLMVLLILML